MLIGQSLDRARVDDPRLTLVATAHQLGVVGYRDPVGAISPDGRWISYTEGRAVRIQPTAGGADLGLPIADGQVRNLTWLPDSAHVLVEDGGTAPPSWWVYDVEARARQRWRSGTRIVGTLPNGEAREVTIDGLRQVAISSEGRVAAIVYGNEGSELWIFSDDGRPAQVRRVPRAAFPAWGAASTPACLIGARLSLTCSDDVMTTSPALDLAGPPALSHDGTRAYVSAANDGGTLDLWQLDLASRRATRLTSYASDAYQPTTTTDGGLLFKVQSYRTHVADVAASGGPVRPLATFQSETPSWDPNGRAVAVTFGSWRRVIDDAKYPDIAQDIGVIDLSAALPATRPAQVVAASPSEDQSMAWSPDRRWIAFHSHREQSDDVWLRPADGSAADRRISFLGRGAETGWPRWSSDGRSILFTSASKTTYLAVPYIVEVDPSTGDVTRPAREVVFAGIDGMVAHAEWLPNGRDLVMIVVGSRGQQTIVTGSRDGGGVRTIHAFPSEHGYPGLAVSPDGRDVAFIAPAPDGFFQVFRLPIGGGSPTAVTIDPSNKTQPAWSPDRSRIAFTVWNYDATFWLLPAGRSR